MERDFIVFFLIVAVIFGFFWYTAENPQSLNPYIEKSFGVRFGEKLSSVCKFQSTTSGFNQGTFYTKCTNACTPKDCCILSGGSASVSVGASAESAPCFVGDSTGICTTTGKETICDFSSSS